MSLDLTKPVQRKDGTKSRIICTDLKSEYCIVAAFQLDNMPEFVDTYTRDGINDLGNDENDRFDLINVPDGDNND